MMFTFVRNAQAAIKITRDLHGFDGNSEYLLRSRKRLIKINHILSKNYGYLSKLFARR